MHGVVRIVGKNDIGSLAVDDERWDYIIGVAFWPLFFSLLLLLWTSLLCLPLCRNGLIQSKQRRLYKVVFVASLFFSIIGLVLMIVGAHKLQNGFEDAVDQLGTTSDAMVTIATLIRSLSNLSADVLNWTNDLKDGCVGSFIQIGVITGSKPAKLVADVSSVTLEVLESVTADLTSKAGSLQEKVDGMVTFVDDMDELVRGYLSWVVPIFGIMVGLYVVVAAVVVFNMVHKSTGSQGGKRCKIFTCTRAPTTKMSAACKQFCVRLVDRVVFPTLVVLDLLLIVICGLTFAVSILIADLCYPNPWENMFDVFNYYFDYNGPLSFIEEALFYWGACSVYPDVSETLKEINPFSAVVQGGADAVLLLKEASNNVSSAFRDAECSALEPPPDWSSVEAGWQDVESLLGCGGMIPEIISGVLDDGICGGVQPGLAWIGVGCVVGVGFLLVALSVRSIFNEQKEQCCSCDWCCCAGRNKAGFIASTRGDINELTYLSERGL